MPKKRVRRPPPPKAPWTFKGWEPHPDPEASAALARVLASWDRTPYMAGQQCKKAGVDCVRFVCGCLDELAGIVTPIHTIPPDTCFHDPETAHAAADKIRSLYLPVQDVDFEREKVRPGDVLITGPVKGGPGHAMIVGPEPNTVWHSAHAFYALAA